MRRKDDLSIGQKIAALATLAGFIVCAIHSAFVAEWQVTAMFIFEFGVLLYFFADSFNHEFSFVPDDHHKKGSNGYQVSKPVAGSVEGTEESDRK